MRWGAKRFRWGNQGDLIANRLQAAREFAGGTLGIAAVEEIAAAFAILNPRLSQDMPGDDQYAMRHGNRSFLQSAPLCGAKE